MSTNNMNNGDRDMMMMMTLTSPSTSSDALMVRDEPRLQDRIRSSSSGMSGADAAYAAYAQTRRREFCNRECRTHFFVHLAATIVPIYVAFAVFLLTSNTDEIDTLSSGGSIGYILCGCSSSTAAYTPLAH